MEDVVNFFAVGFAGIFCIMILMIAVGILLCAICEIANSREERISRYRPLHKPVFPSLKERMNDSEWSWCSVHQCTRDDATARVCTKCQKEFKTNKLKQLPGEYAMYSYAMKFPEWYWLKRQDKYAQLGFLTEKETRENKYAFLREYCVPMWQKRIAKEEIDILCEKWREQKQKEQEERKSPAKIIW